jgi:hypothetical protein
MRTITRLLPVVLLPMLLAGCATTSLTNLTPTTQPRNPSGQYLVEMELDSRQQSLRHPSIVPSVFIGFDSYKMTPTLKMTNRWEAYIPVAADKTNVIYHFKVSYDYNRFGQPGKGSRMSSEYKLIVTDK